jgi:uncharacterized Tic20 family protein
MNDFTNATSQPRDNERLLAILSHILCLVVGLGFIPPLIIYLLKKDESPYVAAHARESLNFQLTMLILCVLLFISIVGILLIWIVGLLNLVLVIVATIRAADNELYRYPFSLRLVR